MKFGKHLKAIYVGSKKLREEKYQVLKEKPMKLFQMDVKSAFLNGFINELVFVEQPLGFEDPRYHNHVYRLHKALYGLKQAPRAWYERLHDFLLNKGFKIRRVDTTLYHFLFN